MPPLNYSPERLLDTCEVGRTRTPIGRALLLLELATGVSDPDALLKTPVGPRDLALVALRRHLFGPTLPILSRCPNCQEEIESEIDAAALLEIAPLDLDAVTTAEIGGQSVQLRLTNSADMLALADTPPAEAERTLAARCAPEVAPEQSSEVLQALAAADPASEILLGFSCPACGTGFSRVLDVASILWTELEAWSERTLDEVHVLARAYGWTEAEVFQLSAVRRQAYLRRVLA